MIFSGRINRVEKPGTDDSFLTTDGEPLPCCQSGVVILNKEPVTAAPIILAEHRTGARLSGFIGPVPSAALDKLLFCCCEVSVPQVFGKVNDISLCSSDGLHKSGADAAACVVLEESLPHRGEGGRGPAQGRMRAKFSLPPIDEWLREPGPHQSPSVTASPCAGEAFLTFSRAARRTAACKSGSRAPHPADL